MLTALFVGIIPVFTTFALLFHKLPDYLLLHLASVEGIRDLCHDVGVGDVAMSSSGLYEVGAVGVKMKRTV